MYNQINVYQIPKTTVKYFKASRSNIDFNLISKRKKNTSNIVSSEKFIDVALNSN